MMVSIDSASMAACLEQIKANAGAYYVYVLSRPNFIPFYVGCGLARGRGHERIQDHAMYARTKRPSHKSNVIRSIWDDGLTVSYSIDGWHKTVESVFAREVELIASIGRRDLGRGPLVNGNDGGTGQFNPSPEIIEKMKATKRRRFAEDPGISARISEAAKIRMSDPNVRAHLANAANEQWSDPDARQRRSVISKALWENDEYRERLRAVHRVRSARSDVKEEFARRIGPSREMALAKSAEVRRQDGAWKVKIAETKRAAAKAKYELRDLCIAAAAGAELPDHRASISVWTEVAKSFGIMSSV